MYERTLDFLSKKSCSAFAVVAWIAFIVGGAALTVLTIGLALTFELLAQVKSKVSSSINALL
jgi:hypothetical protein